ncbi:hypothetical protein Taro_021595 [Colocasia esculenta]|uniref:Uncharacterized protein n=1 Tax=Colocasia esculenta TaxID=4460 RepID=A0A843V5F6_COLES|nr:hypothetical protein [Colocasia esculenta]
MDRSEPQDDEQGKGEEEEDGKDGAIAWCSSSVRSSGISFMNYYEPVAYGGRRLHAFTYVWINGLCSRFSDQVYGASGNGDCNR